MPSLMRMGMDALSYGSAILGRNIPRPAAPAREPDRREPDSLASFRALVQIDHSDSLSLLIESEIIPRLMLAHAIDPHAPPHADSPAGAAIDAQEVEAIARKALQLEADVLLAYVETIIARGVSVETVMVDLLAPAARLLGEYWEDDRCDFVDVTMGLWRLQEIVHEIGAGVRRNRMAAGGHSALFASMPGDQHSFGTLVVEEVFRRDGWDTDRLCEAETPDLLKRVADDWFDMIGLTISCDFHIGTLSSLIAAMRNVSRNPRACVMVGGRVFVADPDLAAKVGADGTAGDAKIALKVAAALVREREQSAAHSP